MAATLREAAESIQEELPFRDGLVQFKLGEFRHALRAMLEAVEIETDDGTPVPVRLRGTGFQSALVLGILRHVARQEAPTGGNVLFAIEEPEAFLHPHTQRAMTRVLRSIAEDAQVVVTTHSPILIDSFNISRTLRLPLDPTGLRYKWGAPPLSAAADGRLTRWSNASNSELIFARTVVVVEGESDLQFIRYILDDLCGGPNEHHSRGVSVLAAGGLGVVKNVLELADRFGVPSYVIADKDCLAGAASGRRLFDVLDGRPNQLSADTRQQLVTIADENCATYEDARRIQNLLNARLSSQGVFVYSSDLEGVLVDTLGIDFLMGQLGPDGEGVLAKEFVDELDAAADARSRLARRLGSKDWNPDTKPKHKLPPHLPRFLLETFATGRNAWAPELVDLRAWLESAVLANLSAAAPV